jgi:hypothetical protein
VSKVCHCWYCRKPAVSIWFVGQHELAFPMCRACTGHVRACLELRATGGSATADLKDLVYGIRTGPDQFRLDGGAWREGPATQHQALAIAEAVLDLQDRHKDCSHEA